MIALTVTATVPTIGTYSLATKPTIARLAVAMDCQKSWRGCIGRFRDTDAHPTTVGRFWLVLRVEPALGHLHAGGAEPGLR